jgi:starch synthase
MGLPGLEPRSSGPLVTVVSRLVQQKGVDLLLPLVGLLDRLPVQLAILGDGDADLAGALEAAAAGAPDRMAFRRGYDEGLSHLLFGGGDLLAMPSRFEPCGLAQMQAMRYGTLPVVTDVGGLHDTVVDIDDHPATGTGVVARDPSSLAVLDALHRGVRAHRTTTRRQALQRRGMGADWSWTSPARQHIDLYRRLIGGAPWTP